MWNNLTSFPALASLVGSVVSNLQNPLSLMNSANNTMPMGPGQQFYLFGYPVAHSASPAFHNEIFGMLGDGKRYEVYSTSKVTKEMLERIKSEEFGGSSVTMPIKAAIIPYLDDISEESRATQAVNTIVKVPVDSPSDSPSNSSTRCKYVGTNTDILGVKNALLRGLRQQFPDVQVGNMSRYADGAGAGVVVGGGATTRSAVYALTMLGLDPIYLVNRDKKEVDDVRNAFPALVKKGSLVHLDHPDSVEKLLAKDGARPVLMIVGAIPAIRPVTREERMVYTVASSLLTLPYSRVDKPNGERKEEDLPVPKQRLFLEMAYKPRNTPMLSVATAHGWLPINGIQAMVEQGYAQQRMWLSGSVDPAVGSDPTILGDKIQAHVRSFVENMQDIHVNGVEVDLAKDLEWAQKP